MTAKGPFCALRPARLLLLAALISLHTGTSPAAAATAGNTRALCIGFGTATNGAAALWAEEDAVAVGMALTSKGYDVTFLLAGEATTTAVREALADAPRVLYFAGHARDGMLTLPDGQLPVSTLTPTVSVLLLDCCFLGDLLSPKGHALVFAAAEEHAFEAQGSGLFTFYLVKWLTTPRAKRTQHLVDYVQAEVTRETGGWQRPVYGRL